MKLSSIKVALLPALVLTSALLAVAAGQPKVHMLSKDETQDLTGATRAVQQGKGGGMSRNQLVFRGNAYRSQTAAEESRTAKDGSIGANSNWHDTAFRK
jgi:hypothetical protein